MDKVFTEENNIYQLDCSKAIWATDELHDKYMLVGNRLNDVDFIIEDTDKVIMMEYKNACIEGASAPDNFNPLADKKINNIVKKFYDSLHYLVLLQKDKDKCLVYVLEYPTGDSTSRKLLRNRIMNYLPFRLQDTFDSGVKLISKFEVLSINEWNEKYEKYPLQKIEVSQ